MIMPPSIASERATVQDPLIDYAVEIGGSIFCRRPYETTNCPDCVWKIAGTVCQMRVWKICDTVANFDKGTNICSSLLH